MSAWIKRARIGSTLIGLATGMFLLPCVGRAQVKLTIPFEHQGAGSETTPVECLMLRYGTEPRTASNVIVNALAALHTAIVKDGRLVRTLQPNVTYSTDYELLDQTERDSYNQAVPHNRLPAEVFGVKYRITYSVDTEQFEISLVAILGVRGADGPKNFHVYPGTYDRNALIAILRRAIENTFASGIYDRGDLTDPAGLVKTIVAHHDPVAQYLWQLAGTGGQASLSEAAQQATLGELGIKTLLQLLDHALYDGLIYTTQRFSGVVLSSKLQKLIQLSRSDPYYTPLANRALLEASYPHLIRPSPTFRQLYATAPRLGSL